MPTSALLMVVFYMHVSSSDGGGSLCPRQLVWRWWGPMSVCLVMVHALQTAFLHFNVTVRLHVFFGRPHPRLAPAVQRRTVLRNASRDMRPTYWPVFRNRVHLLVRTRDSRSEERRLRPAVPSADVLCQTRRDSYSVIPLMFSVP